MKKMQSGSASEESHSWPLAVLDMHERLDGGWKAAIHYSRQIGMSQAKLRDFTFDGSIPSQSTISMCLCALRNHLLPGRSLDAATDLSVLVTDTVLLHLQH